MARAEMNIDINMSLRVPDETVKCCMRLLEMYLDDHPEKTLLMECDESRKHHVVIEDQIASKAVE